MIKLKKIKKILKFQIIPNFNLEGLENKYLCDLDDLFTN